MADPVRGSSCGRLSCYAHSMVSAPPSDTPSRSPSEPATAVGSELRVRAIMNRNSGTAGEAETLTPHIQEVLAGRSWSVQTEVVPGADLDAAIRAALEHRPDVLLIGGGDGTIRTAISRVLGTKTALGIIPMGTMNFVAKDLGIPTNPAEAIASLASAEVRAVDVGEVNGRHFFHSSAIGIVPTLTEKRERIRAASHWRERAGHMIDAIRTAGAARPLSLSLEHDGKRRANRTFSIIVANNALSSDPLTPYRRHVVDGGELSVYVASHSGRFGIARLLFTFGSGWWFWDSAISEIKTPRLRVHARRKRIAVSNDGELDVLSLPLRYSIHAKAIRVLAPPRAQTAETGSSSLGS